MVSTRNGTRAIALVGPAGAGKTTLAEALLFASGATNRQGSVDQGTSVGDSSAEARARIGSTELNLMRFDYLDDSFALLDIPGAAGFAADGAAALCSADMAIVVVDPDPDRAALVGPVLRRLDELGLPHAIFVNRIDQARGHVMDLLAALQPHSAEPLLARQLPLAKGIMLSASSIWHWSVHIDTYPENHRKRSPSLLMCRQRKAASVSTCWKRSRITTTRCLSNSCPTKYPICAR